MFERNLAIMNRYIYCKSFLLIPTIAMLRMYFVNIGNRVGVGLVSRGMSQVRVPALLDTFYPNHLPFNIFMRSLSLSAS